MFSIGRLALCAADMYMLYSFFQSIFELKCCRNRRLWCALAATLLIFAINVFGHTGLNLLVIPVIYMVFSLLVFKLSIANGFVYTVIYYAIFAGGREVAYEMLFRLISSYSQLDMPHWYTQKGFYFLLPEYLISFLFLLLIERVIKRLDIRDSGKFAWYLLIMPVSSMIVLSSFLYMDFPKSELIQRLMCIGAFLLYFSNAAVFIILSKYTTILNQTKFEEIYSMKQAMEDDKFQNIARLNEHYRNYMHDMHSYLSHLRMLALGGQNQEIVKTIEELRGGIQMEVDDTIYSDNKVLNSILTERAIKARDEGIRLSVFVEQFLDIYFISNKDMVSMFGNLLDNALEAASRCERRDKEVEMKLFMGTQYMLVLYLENSFEISAQWEDGKLLSTKKDGEYHGLGIGIVKRLAEKYGGTLTLEEKEGKFITTLIISAYADR